MSKLNEIFLNNKQIIGFVMMLLLLTIMIIIFIYLRSNIEYVKMNPCDYCMNKTKFTCIYYDNGIFGDSREDINLTLDQLKDLKAENYTPLKSANS